MRRGLRITLAVALLFVILDAASAAYANSVLSVRYSPRQAALDYFSAQKRGDARGMTAVASFLHGKAAQLNLFGRTAVAGMLLNPENTDVVEVRVLSVDLLDANTAKVGMSMRWAGVSRTLSYLVRRDLSQVHYIFYNTWRIQIPFATIGLDLPNQAGPVYLDNRFVHVGGSVKAFQAIAGYHRVKMNATSFYDASEKVVNTVDADSRVKLDGTISSAASSAATVAIMDTFNNHCDSSKYHSCTGHTYTAPNDGQIWYLSLPGYPEIDFKSYVYSFTSDPTARMKLAVSAEDRKMTAVGTCAVTLTVDGSRTYRFAGTWTATLTWNGSEFAETQVSSDCVAAKA